jgi:hypothetical protein
VHAGLPARGRADRGFSGSDAHTVTAEVDNISSHFDEEIDPSRERRLPFENGSWDLSVFRLKLGAAVSESSNEAG